MEALEGKRPGIFLDLLSVNLLLDYGIKKILEILPQALLSTVRLLGKVRGKKGKNALQKALSIKKSKHDTAII